MQFYEAFNSYKFFLAHGKTVVHQSSKDHRTVFVSNLDFSTDETLIRDVFASCGKITDLRLVRDYKGRSKGYCYVEFEKSVSEALHFLILYIKQKIILSLRYKKFVLCK